MEDAAPASRRADPLSWAVFAVLAAVYRWGRCATFGPGESAEVVYRALYSPGRDPLVRLCRAAAGLPFDTPEGWINGLSGLFHAASVAFLFDLLRRLGLKRLPALAAAAMLGFAPQFWYYALVAGHAAAATLGLAVALWSMIAWKEESRAWPLLLGATGLAVFAHASVRADSLAPAAFWALSLLAGLMIQRLSLRRPATAGFFLAAALLLALANPYDARRHNPTAEWALAASDSIKPGDSVAVADPGLRAALAYAAAKTGKPSPFVGEGDVLYEPAVAERLIGSGFVPDGLLVRQSRKSLPPAEAARRAAAVLEIPALGSVGRRDLRRYGFTKEGILYEEYRAILTRYSDSVPSDSPLRARLDAQLAEYEPGPAAKP